MMSKRVDDVAGIWDGLCTLAIQLKVEPMSQLPECWEHKLDEHWAFAVNGHNAPMQASRFFPSPVVVPPFCLYVEFNGFPAGILNPYRGEFVAGILANAKKFRKALK